MPAWKRSQVIAALWRYQATTPHWGADQHAPAIVPRTFASRVQKLLDLDRQPNIMPWADPVEGEWAFFDGPGGGPGVEECFTLDHAWLLGIALELVNQGLKQSEIVFLIRKTRYHLEAILHRIRGRPVRHSPIRSTAAQRELFSDGQGAAPIYVRPDRTPLADWSCWLLLRRREATEVYPRLEATRRGKHIPLYFPPEAADGLEALKERLFTHRNGFTSVILVEVAELAIQLPEYLAAAPEIRRGRKKEPGHA